jgi:hypothetical protein
MDCMKRPFAASVRQEGDWYVAQCLEIDVASQGETEDEASSESFVDTVIVPRKREIPVGTRRSILNQAHLDL